MQPNLEGYLKPRKCKASKEIGVLNLQGYWTFSGNSTFKVNVLSCNLTLKVTWNPGGYTNLEGYLKPRKCKASKEKGVLNLQGYNTFSGNSTFKVKALSC